MIKQILSSRFEKHGQDYGIVHEWEDILSESLSLPIVKDCKKLRSKYIFVKFPHLAKLIQTSTPSFLYTMLPLGNPPGNNKKNIITCIIDFFLRDKEELELFYHTYQNNPIVLISSKEAYDYLKSQNCPLKIHHWALSISDKYKITSDILSNKKYDVVMLGRQNPVLKNYLEKYQLKHPELTYIYRKQVEKKWFYYDNHNKSIGELTTRKEYMELLKQARIGLYATPGMDNARDNTKGFNQVTPRFLEYLVSGCHVIARYPQNADTDFYEINKFSPNIETYEAFEKAMDYARYNDINTDIYSTYLQKHYTSVRAKQLQSILKNL